MIKIKEWKRIGKREFLHFFHFPSVFIIISASLRSDLHRSSRNATRVLDARIIFAKACFYGPAWRDDPTHPTGGGWRLNMKKLRGFLPSSLSHFCLPHLTLTMACDAYVHTYVALSRSHRCILVLAREYRGSAYQRAREALSYSWLWVRPPW